MALVATSYGLKGFWRAFNIFYALEIRSAIKILSHEERVSVYTEDEMKWEGYGIFPKYVSCGSCRLFWKVISKFDQ